MECPEDTLIHTESPVGCRAGPHQPPEPPGRPRLTWCGSHQLPGGHYRSAAPSWRCQWWPPGSGEHGGAGEQAPLAALGRPCNTPLTTLWIVSWSERGEGPCGLLTRREGMIPRYGYHDASRKTHMQPSPTMRVTAQAAWASLRLPQLNSPLGSVATSSRKPSSIPCLSPSSPSFLPSVHLSYMVLLTSAVFSMTFLCVFFFSSTGLCAPEEHGLVSRLSHSVWNPQTWAQCLAQSQPPGNINLIKQLTKWLLKL